MASAWVEQAFGGQEVRLVERHGPSTEAHARAATMAWGLAVRPEQMAALHLAGGVLLPVHPQVHGDVRLRWHPWRLLAAEVAPPEPPPPLRASALDRIGRALAEGARTALRPTG